MLFLLKINNEVDAILGDDCLFDHADGPYNEHNDLSNSSADLRDNLEDAGDNSGRPIMIEFGLDGRVEEAELKFNAHHLLPADASVNKATELLKIMNSQDNGGDLKGDIGYGVNHENNGMFLPTEDAWDVARFGTWKGLQKIQDGYRLAYAYAYWAMRHTGRQFHTSHGDYSLWVLSRLEEIKMKMLQAKRECKENKCKKTKPWKPPYNLVGKLDAIAEHISSYLREPSYRWLAPLVTSPESELYKFGMTPEEFGVEDR
ncbi:MAG TPA: AHH domain-containing protein [Gemmatimonadaceae bacterium]|jgi:hypothetical protein